MFVDMMGGRQPRLVAAMKSLPLREDDTPANSSPAERDLVARLSHECSAQLEGACLVLTTVRKASFSMSPPAFTLVNESRSLFSLPHTHKLHVSDTICHVALSRAGYTVYCTHML